MCGIAGQLRFDDVRVDRHLVERMTRRQAHRGPDGEGFHFDHRIGMGHRRLALVDPFGPNQPLGNEDRTLWLVGNHEIYNDQELRRSLIARGHAFRTGNDGEVILHRFEEVAAAAFGELIGMFAFALWDSAAEALYLVRDPFGVKPLHYCRGSDGAFLFASELGALLQDIGVDRTPDYTAIDGYFRTLTIPEPATAFRAVRKVPAGHYLRLSRSGMTMHRYFDLELGGPTEAAETSAVPDEERMVLALGEALDDTVRLSLRGDVPLGFFLSGGVDSSALVATASRFSSERLRTYSLGFDEPAFDERRYSAMVSETFATDHCALRLSSNAAADVAETILAQLAEPFADSSALPTYVLAQRAAEDVKGVLSGEGLDELMAGNAWHTAEGDGAEAEHAADPEGLLDHPSRAVFSPSSLANLYHPGFRALKPHGLVDDRQRSHTVRGRSRLDRQLAFDLRTYLPSDLLTKMDRLPMAASLEVRVPYLNEPFTRFVAGIDGGFKFRGGVRKYLLKSLLRGVVPDAVLDRPKRGFAVPLDIWLWKDGRFREMVEDVLRDSRTSRRGIFDAAHVAALLDEHGNLAARHGHRIWTLFVFEMWQRNVIDPATTAATARTPD